MQMQTATGMLQVYTKHMNLNSHQLHVNMIKIYVTHQV